MSHFCMSVPEIRSNVDSSVAAADPAVLKSRSLFSLDERRTLSDYNPQKLVFGAQSGASGAFQAGALTGAFDSNHSVLNRQRQRHSLNCEHRVLLSSLAVKAMLGGHTSIRMQCSWP